ncbi:MAG: cysteine--tRNA ligase [archaeon]|nr:MAG: cysteine--tRNA ligase [archaeon]
MLKLFNSLGRSLEEFVPCTDGEVRMYTCGPTVWNYAHIGNLRTFVFEDVLRRYLKFKGYKVFQVMNITDVEDRIIKGIKETGKPLAEHTRFYEAAFMEDLAALFVERAEKYPRATEHVQEMVALIKVLLQKGFAYTAPDGSVYFSVSKFPSYGALSGVRLDSLKSAGRVSTDHYEEKTEAADFALWKSWDRDDGDVFWETELGKGRPGWHIECSAMSMKYLGESFDIHTGGLDNKFPHHENEIAQSESATGKKFVKYWLHSDFLSVEGAEMHKSVGNVVYLRDLVKEGWSPRVVRTFLISSHYRDRMDLTNAGLAQAKALRERLQEFSRRLESVKGTSGSDGGGLGSEMAGGFEEAMDRDLNVPEALAAIFVVAKKTNLLIDGGKLSEQSAGEVLGALRRVDSVLGVLDFSPQELTSKEAALLAAREEARKRRDFAESDRLRKELLSLGVVVEDTPKGTRWKKPSSG